MLEKRSGARVLDHDDSFKPQKKIKDFQQGFTMTFNSYMLK